MTQEQEAARMDFHALPRRDLQALCKRNGVRANIANAAMADALSALPKVRFLGSFPVSIARSEIFWFLTASEFRNSRLMGSRST